MLIVIPQSAVHHICGCKCSNPFVSKGIGPSSLYWSPPYQKMAKCKESPSNNGSRQLPCTLKLVNMIHWTYRTMHNDSLLGVSVHAYVGQYALFKMNHVGVFQSIRRFATHDPQLERFLFFPPKKLHQVRALCSNHFLNNLVNLSFIFGYHKLFHFVQMLLSHLPFCTLIKWKTHSLRGLKYLPRILGWEKVVLSREKSG